MQLPHLSGLLAITNDKAQMSNQAQRPKDKKVRLDDKWSSLAFNLPAKARQAGHLDFVCYLDFDIWVFVNGFLIFGSYSGLA
jgi:hypothetical protein